MKEFNKNTKFIWSYLKKQKKELIIYIITNIIYIGISILVPIISARQIIYLTDSKFDQLIMISVVIFFVEICRNIINYFAAKSCQVMYRETFIRLQNDLGKSILKLENRVVDNNSSGVFIQRLTGDTSKISDFYNMFIGMSTEIITDIGIFGALFIINKYICLYLVFTLLFVYYLENTRSKIYNDRDKKFRKENEKISGFVGEMVRGVRDIKMLNSEDSFLNSLYEKTKNLNEKKYEMASTNRKYRLVIGNSKDIFNLLLVMLLIMLVGREVLAVANAIVVYNYSSRVSSLTYQLSYLIDGIKDFNLSSTRVSEIIDSENYKKEVFGSIHIDKVNGDFEFKDVYFKYDKKNVLKGLSFKVNANETVGFVGKSGAGKSTIFSLLCKMYDVNKGEILIDGINIEDLDKDSIRGNITIISQNPYIFNMSIKENLKIVKNDVSDKEIKEACKIACLDKFINSLPDKYDTIVGEGGITLSGGQKQRLAIARALVQKTEIILFDEATSALDNETQEEIKKAIANMKGEYTILIIAHRLTTVMDSDKIFVIDDGKVVGTGTHEKLLKTNNIYKQIYAKELEK